MVLNVWSLQAQNQIIRGTNKTHSVKLVTGNAGNAVYSWAVIPASGSSTNIDVVADSVITISWDGEPGIYTLMASVVDGNGCVSERISREFEIVSPGDLIFAASTPSTSVCSALAVRAGGQNLQETQSTFQVVYAGDANLTSAKITVRNPNGEFIDLDGNVLSDQDNPEVLVKNDGDDKIIDLNIDDGWENTRDSEVLFTIKLISVLTPGNLEIPANQQNDVVRTITVLPKPVIGF